MASSRRGASAIAVGLLCLFAHDVARAAPRDDAMDLFEKGRAARKKGDCATAIPLFQKAKELYPTGLGSLRNLAECEEALGRWASAKRHWLELGRAVLVTREPKYAGWGQDARAGVDRVKPKVAHLVVVVTAGGAKPTDAAPSLVVRVNGEALDPTLLGSSLDRDPGSYVVRVEGGKAPVEAAVDLAAGEERTVTLAIEIAPPPAPRDDARATQDPRTTPSPAASSTIAAPPPTTVDAGEGDVHATRRTIGWVSIGIGGAALVGTSIALGVRQSALSDFHDACPGGRCPDTPENRATVRRGQTASTLVDVFGAITVVGVGIGLGLVLSSPRPEARGAGLVRVVPYAGTSGAGAAIWGTF